MTWPIALFLACVAMLALGFVGAIAAMLGLQIHDAIARAFRRGLQ